MKDERLAVTQSKSILYTAPLRRVMEFFAHETMRPSQDQLILDVAATIKNKGVLFAQAPTGLGKTAAVLAPALKAASEHDLTIFFLTSRHTQHKIVVDTLVQIAKKSGKKVPVMDLIGRRAMCVNSDVNVLSSRDFGEKCRRLRSTDSCSYYSEIWDDKKLSETTRALLTGFRQEPSHVEDVISLCSSNGVCPYFMTQLLGKKARIVVADYYHLFNDTIRDSLFEFAHKSLSNSIIIIDEAHNLPSRIRELLSDSTNTFGVYAAAKESETFDKELSEMLREFGEFLEREILLIPQEARVEREWLLSSLESMWSMTLGDVIIHLDRISEKVLEKEGKSACANLSHFFSAWLSQGSEFVRIVSREYSSGKAYAHVSVRCLDPAVTTKNVLSRAHASILMSGTLKPLRMYADVLGLSNATLKEYPSPFPKKNKRTFIIPDTTTKYSSRSDTQYARIAAHCLRLVNNTPVNTAVFFPSYAVLKSVRSYIEESCEKTLFIEDRSFSKEEKTAFIERFKTYGNKGGAVLLGVVGGSFSEGYDFAGDVLRMVLVVGVPLGKPDVYTNELIKQYETRFSQGWNYGYIAPALTRVLQAAGRTIRSSTDSGVIVLLDERYAWSAYAQFVPDDAVTVKDPLPLVQKFFNSLA